MMVEKALVLILVWRVFTYSFVVDYLDKLSHVITFSSEPPDMATQKYAYGLKSNYTSFKDLSFMTYKDALSEVKKILNSINFPEFEVSKHIPWN